MCISHPTRRDFLGTAAGTAALAAAFTILPRHVLGGPRHVAPSDKLNIAGIGVGGMGGTNLGNMATENIVAICDVDPGYAAGTIKKYPKAKVYSDCREMLEKQKDIDAVLIATAPAPPYHRAYHPACWRAWWNFAAALTEVCLLGNIAKRVNGRIEWDAAAMKITNNAEANKYVRAEYRPGWSL